MSSTDVLPEALRDALGQVLATERRNWQREREVIEAQSRAIVAEMQSTIIRLETDVRRLVEDRLASLKDGEPGPAGRDGVDGAPGKEGRDGLDGRNGIDGAAGENGRDGVDGQDGRNGADGKDGERGLDGLPGAAGRDGLDGQNGRDGLDGKDGQPGADGLPGADGRDGLDGARGPEGPAGKLPRVRAWADQVHYESDVVTHAGSLFQAQRDTAREPPHEDWLCIASAGQNGRDGQDGRSINVRGTWADGVEYRSLDLVALNGASFVARHDNPGPCPGPGWQLSSTQGKRGEPGKKGDTGQGLRGEPGPRVVALVADPDAATLSLIHEDGSEVSGDLYPLLEKVR